MAVAGALWAAKRIFETTATVISAGLPVLFSGLKLQDDMRYARGFPVGSHAVWPILSAARLIRYWLWRLVGSVAVAKRLR